ncbi:TetR/AcrR family transcriptional regulator [Saccharothrix syringae]|uniref:TetR/AcrR family transcriptional regulator n=1 Tax=Saccharothrix syringae TaxID=103733 RepID=A0A5Q0H5K4_SACSY|nr:TetR/AcrR family transcriptional regulator [Saccharothrix syringae]QFZ21175.1 TetR/AcrR family transcriptional regulator [Saccharothrix syringae]
MPTPERTSLAEIVAAARDILEREGLANLTMQAVAARVGVRAPSLYKRVRNRDDLVRLVTEAAIRDLGERFDAVPVGGDARADLRELCREFRAFAHAHPAGYRLVFADSGAGKPDVGLFAMAAAPVLRVAAELAGPEEALEAARTITAWAHGFVSMELADAFNLGGDVERAFEYGIARIADSLAKG